MKTFKEEIVSILVKEIHYSSGERKYLNDLADQIIQSLLNRLPKEKEKSEELMERTIDQESYIQGQTEILKELTEIITGK